MKRCGSFSLLEEEEVIKDNYSPSLPASRPNPTFAESFSLFQESIRLLTPLLFCKKKYCIFLWSCPLFWREKMQEDKFETLISILFLLLLFWEMPIRNNSGEKEKGKNLFFPEQKPFLVILEREKSRAGDTKISIVPFPPPLPLPLLLLLPLQSRRREAVISNIRPLSCIFISLAEEDGEERSTWKKKYEILR